MRAFLLLGSLIFVAGTALGGEARGATIVEFYGPHPIDPSVNSGLCTIGGAHMHSYRPHDEVLYVNDGPYWTFVGDPTEFEPAPPASVAYYGHHPVWWTHDPGEHYCYISGPHHHGHAPPPTLSFSERGGAYWYVGAQPAWVERGGKRGRRIDDHYHKHAIVRPIVTSAPPTGWVGVTFGGGGGGGAIGVGFGLPVVIEHSPPPVIIIEHQSPGPYWWKHNKGKHGNKYGGKHDGKHGGKRGKGHGKHK